MASIVSGDTAAGYYGGFDIRGVGSAKKQSTRCVLSVWIVCALDALAFVRSAYWRCYIYRIWIGTGCKLQSDPVYDGDRDACTFAVTTGSLLCVYQFGGKYCYVYSVGIFAAHDMDETSIVAAYSPMWLLERFVY